jgi:hypothetical protein
MAALVLNVSDTENVSDQIAMGLGLNVLDSININDQIGQGLGLNVFDSVDAIDDMISVVPSYLDGIYIADIEHFINILSVE